MRKLRVAINGYGRIGRNIVKAFFEYKKHPDIEIVAINDLCDPEAIELLTRYDSVHGVFQEKVSWNHQSLIINDSVIRFFSERNPEDLPWKELEIDIVFECTGRFASREAASAHLRAGAKQVLISAPAGRDVDATVVFGVNHHVLKKDFTVVSNASCTTNCLASMVAPLHRAFGIEHGVMTTIHSYTNDQVLNDVAHKDLRRARSAGVSMIPTKTGAAGAVGLVIPELNGKLDGYSIRVPTPNVSLVDLTFTATQPHVSAEMIATCIREAAAESVGQALTYTVDPLVSVDFNHNPSSCIFDMGLTKVVGGSIKVFGWYDNEWGFCNRMLDTASYMGSLHN